MKMRRVPSSLKAGKMTAQQASIQCLWARLRVLSFYLVVFASGCAMTAYMLHFAAGAPQLDRTAAKLRQSARVTSTMGGEARISRRGLYTSDALEGHADAAGRHHIQVPTGSLRGSGAILHSAGSKRRAEARAAARSTAPEPPGSKPSKHSSSRSSSDGSSPSPGASVAPKAGHIPPPPAFDWRAYLLRYPDLRTAKIRTKEAATDHYTSKGHKERRSYEKVPVLLRYTACQGLFNQMYAHLNAFILAEFLGADVVLPPSVYRESFSKYFSMMDLTKNEVKWTPTHTGALLDVKALQEHYAKKGVKVYETPHYDSFPDCMHPQDAYPRYKMDGIRPEQIVQLGDIYLQSIHIWHMWDKAAERIMAKRQELLDEGWPVNTTVVLDLPCPFLSIMTLTCLEAAQEAATALKFNRSIVQMARTIINGMKRDGVTHYNGAHLRLEKDAVDWARVLGGLPKYLGEYAKSFAAAGFSQQRDIYIASGLLSYNASAEMKQMLEFLAPYARTVRYKEMYLPPELLNGLNPEQEALVDFLVIANADSFVGLGSSTFSVYLREYRVLLGHERMADVFVDTSKIGTDALFERCTHFAPLDTTPGDLDIQRT